MYLKVVVDSDIERLQLMNQQKEILERQAKRAAGQVRRLLGPSMQPEPHSLSEGSYFPVEVVDTVSGVIQKALGCTTLSDLLLWNIEVGFMEH